MKKTDDRVIFLQPKSYRFIVNHGEKLFYALVLLGVFTTYNDLKGQFLIDVIVIIIILLFLLFFLGKLLKRVIWKFEIDFNENKIYFHLCRKSEIRTVNFRDINSIIVSGPIIFKIKGKKFLYSTNLYTEILPVISRVKKIEWGRFCNILGPDKEIRNKFTFFNN
jgi:hypothetical protein